MANWLLVQSFVDPCTAILVHGGSELLDLHGKGMSAGRFVAFCVNQEGVFLRDSYFPRYRSSCLLLRISDKHNGTSFTGLTLKTTSTVYYIELRLHKTT